MPKVGHHAAKRRIHARETRNDGGGKADFTNEGAGMERPAPTKRHRRKAFRVMSPLDRDQPDGTRHLGVCNTDDGFGRLMNGNPERRGYMGVDGGSRGLAVQPCQPVADGIAGINTPQDKIGVRYGRAVIPKAITDRSRVRPCTLRADVEKARVVDMGDRAAARPDGRHLDHRGADHHAEINACL